MEKARKMEKDFYLVASQPDDGWGPFKVGYSIKKYDGCLENFHEGFLRSEAYKKKKAFKKEIKSQLNELKGKHVFFAPLKTREELWSFKKLFDDKYFDGHMINEFNVYMIDDHHITDELVGQLELREYTNFSKKNTKKILSFFNKEILK